MNTLMKAIEETLAKNRKVTFENDFPYGTKKVTVQTTQDNFVNHFSFLHVNELVNEEMLAKTVDAVNIQLDKDLK